MEFLLIVVALICIGALAYFSPETLSAAWDWIVHDSWDWLYPERILPVLAVIIILIPWRFLVHLAWNEGQHTRDSDGKLIKYQYAKWGLRRGLSRVAAYLLFFLLITPVTLEHVFKVPVLSNRGLWFSQTEQVVEMPVNLYSKSELAGLSARKAGVEAQIDSLMSEMASNNSIKLEEMKIIMEEANEYGYDADWVAETLEISLSYMAQEDSMRVVTMDSLLTELAGINSMMRTAKEEASNKDSVISDDNKSSKDKQRKASRWWIDIIALLILLALLSQVWSQGKLSLGWSRYAWGITTAMYLMGYLTLRPLIIGKSAFGLSMLINLLQFVVVLFLLIMAYRKLMWMLENEQCYVTVDPISKEPKKFKDVNHFFGLGVGTFGVFVLCFLVLFSFPLDIIKLGGPWGIRIGTLVFTIIVTALTFLASRWDKVVNYLDREINPWVIIIPGLILSILALLLPGAWLFFLLLCVMAAAWGLGAMFRVPIAHKMVPEIFDKDRYWNILYLFARDENGNPKCVMKDGLHITAWAAWAPFTRYFVFSEEVLELDKYKIEDQLPTASKPCKFRRELDAAGNPTGRLIEVIPRDYIEGESEGMPDELDNVTGPPVEFYATQRFRKFEDTRAFLRRDLSDRQDAPGLLRRATQNMLKRLTRRLSMTQALVGGFYTSDKHLFYLRGYNEEPLTFRDAVRLEGMEAIGFLEEDTELSDANPPANLQEAQNALEKSRIELEQARVEAEKIIVAEGAAGAALQAKINNVAEALKNGSFNQEAFAGIQALEFAAHQGTIVLPAGFLDRLSRVAASIGSSGLPPATPPTSS